MADLNKRLLRTVDGPAPQQKVAGKNELEFVEGSDGAQHIKVVGKSGKVQDIGDRLESIENQQQEILERLDGTFNTKVTGSNVEHENFLERGIINKSWNDYVQVPNWAIGAIIQVSIEGIIGDLSGGDDGVSMRVRNYISSGTIFARNQFSDLETQKLKAAFGLTAIIYPIPSIPDNTYSFSVPVVHDSILGNALRIYVNIDGDFAEGEGIDLRGDIHWLRR